MLSPPASVPNGLIEAIEAAGHFVARTPSGWQTDNDSAVQAIIDTYTGGATELAYAKRIKQASLDAAFDNNFDLAKFIRGGTATNITSANVGTFLATITNNYRTLRASIASASTVAAVNAININSGWPSNP